MKTILFFMLLTFQSFAQTNEEELLSFEGRPFTSKTVAGQISEANKILKIAQELTQKRGIQTQVISLQDHQKNRYQALLISPQGTGPQNLEALRVYRSMSGMPLVFSPYDLARSQVAAFFDPDGSKLGVSYKFLVTGVSDYDYQHELQHAMTFAQVLSGRGATWAGIKKLVKGEYLSSFNNSAYFRYASLDELLATVLSVKLESSALLHLKRELTPQEFYKNRGKAYHLFHSIYQTITVGMRLAKQSGDLATRAQMARYEEGTHLLGLGSLKRQVHTTVFNLDSYSWVVGGYDVVPAGSEYTLYWARKVSPNEVKQRLATIEEKSKKAEKFFAEMEKQIKLLIDQPQLQGSNLENLSGFATQAFEALKD